jgi:N-acetylglucosamine-6-phosphate deacetylase
MTVVDIHTHGLQGHDTRTRDPEEILKIAEIHGTRGVSAIIPAVYPASIEEMRANMLAVKEAMNMQWARGDQMHRETRGTPGQAEQGSRGGNSAVILGVYLEGPFLNPLKCGALDAASFLAPGEHHFRKLLEGFEDVARVLVVAPELEGACRLIRRARDAGITVSMGHSMATFREAGEGFNAGAEGITHIFNAMAPFHHREPGLAGFGLLNRHVYVEVIADPHHLHGKTIDLIFRVKEPDKIILVSDSVRETGTPVAAAAIGDARGTLQGGSMPITEAAQRLIGMGFESAMILGSVTRNPSAYLGSDTKLPSIT